MSEGTALAGTKPELKSGPFDPVITRFMRVIQRPRVGGAGESLGAIDIAPLDCPNKSGNDGDGLSYCLEILLNLKVLTEIAALSRQIFGVAPPPLRGRLEGG